MQSYLVPWTGLIAHEGVVSTDNRQIDPEALLFDRLPIPVILLGRATTIGQVDELTRDGADIRASGVADASALPPGQTFACGINLYTSDQHMEGDDPDTAIRVFTCAEIAALVIYADTAIAQPAWPDCQITFGAAA